MIKLGFILFMHVIVMPFILLLLVDAFIDKNNNLQHILEFIIVFLWMFIFGNIYAKKIIKLKKDMDANKN